MTVQAYLSRFALSSGALQFTVDDGTPLAVTLTADDYFPAGYTGEGIGFVDHIQAAIRAGGGGWATATCTLSLTTGLVTLGFSATTSVTWTDTTLRDYLGWTGNLASASSYVAPNKCRFAWLPSLPPSRMPVDLTEFWEWRSNTTAVQGPDGGGHGVVGGEQYSAAIGYSLLNVLDVRIAAGAGQASNRSFERWLRDGPHNAQPIRIVTDSSTYAASTDYKTGIFGHPDGSSPLGSFRDWASPSLGEDDHSLWDVNLHFLKYDGV